MHVKQAGADLRTGANKARIQGIERIGHDRLPRRTGDAVSRDIDGKWIGEARGGRVTRPGQLVAGQGATITVFTQLIGTLTPPIAYNEAFGNTTRSAPANTGARMLPVTSTASVAIPKFG